MPITLLVRSGDRSSSEDAPSLTFDGSQRVVIGRSSGCDLRLPDSSVSHRHASVQAKGAEYVLVDEDSTNGTFVGGVRLGPRTPRVIRSGDILRVGRVWIEARFEHVPVTRDLAAATRELALSLVSRAMAALGDDVTTRVRVVEGPDAGATLPIDENGRTYVIGRGQECDLPLADADASREHLLVTRRAGAVLIRDLGAKNGVMLGDAPLEHSRDTAWRPALMVRLGRTVLALDEPVFAALLELEGSPDEKLPPEDAPKRVAPAPRAVAAPQDAAEQALPSVIPTELAPRAPAPPMSEPAGAAAPIADVPDEGAPQEETPKRRGGWTISDVLVMLLALSILGASIAGLVWLLRG